MGFLFYAVIFLTLYLQPEITEILQSSTSGKKISKCHLEESKGFQKLQITKNLGLEQKLFYSLNCRNLWRIYCEMYLYIHTTSAFQGS